MSASAVPVAREKHTSGDEHSPPLQISEEKTDNNRSVLDPMEKEDCKCPSIKTTLPKPMRTISRPAARCPRCFELLPSYQPHGEDCFVLLNSDLGWRGRHLYLKKRPTGNLTE
jgi:hypothetical protein